MSLELLDTLAKKHPHLKNLISNSRYSLGYSNGGEKGEKIQVFLVGSSWGEYCVTGIAQEPLKAGAVVSLSDDPILRPEGDWLVYSL